MQDAQTSEHQQGFTLIELSIVLVIIGLVVGGVLTGQDLIKAAEVRAQITQIEKYNMAANTFKGKYNYLPGDINQTAATQFGFAARGPGEGEGDGNGVIEGTSYGYSSSPCADGSYGCITGVGETEMFWKDLSDASLISGSFLYASPTIWTDVAYQYYFPAAAIGRNTSILIATLNYTTYFSVAGPVAYGAYAAQVTAGLTVTQAYAIDHKVDDGYPMTGNVLAAGPNSGNGFCWANQLNGIYGNPTVSQGPDTSSRPGGANTCYDNNMQPGTMPWYSVEYNGGQAVTCALIFRSQF